MKIRYSSPIAVAAVLLLLVEGCATYPKSGQLALVGTWANSFGAVWTVKADGTYEADLNRDGKPDSWGKCTVDGNTMTTWRTGGINPKGCDGKGVYAFTRTGDNLKFTLVSDKCKLRRQHALQTWRKK